VVRSSISAGYFRLVLGWRRTRARRGNFSDEVDAYELHLSLSNSSTAVGGWCN